MDECRAGTAWTRVSGNVRRIAEPEMESRMVRDDAGP